MMTDFTPAQARELSNKLMRLERTATESDTATALRSLADQVEKLTAERAAPKAQVIDMRDGKYLDSTPKLHVGSSSFEDWYQAHEKACTGDKQLARDAYAAGMGDPLVTYAQPPQQSEPPEGLPFGIIDPDYAKVFTIARIIAWQYGFALVMHGSFTRDLDLLLVPWEKHACTDGAERVVAMIAADCGLTINGEPGVKPHGRLAYTLLFPGFGDPRWVDLSVMPLAAAPATPKR